MATASILDLASSIEQNTRVVYEYLQENGLPEPSFEATSPPDLPLPPNVSQAKEAALEAMDELQTLLLGPMPKIFHELIHTVRSDAPPGTYSSDVLSSPPA